MKWSRKKRKEMNPKQRRPGKCASPKCHCYSSFSKYLIVCSWLTPAIVDVWPNSVILTTSCLNFLFQKIENKSVQIVQSWQRSSQVEKQRRSTVKSEPLEEIRANLDRIAIKTKVESKGLLVQMHPCKRKKKCQVLQIGQAVLVLQKHAYD